MKNIPRILRYALPYWGFASLNILFNILSVIFSLASFALFIPVLQMLFHVTTLTSSAPPLDWSSSASIKENFYYEIGQVISREGELKALVYISIAIAVLFFLKNLFRFLAMFFLAPVRIGAVKDIRNDIYKKILILPLSFYSEQRKGDIISKMTNDVLEIEVSIMSTLEMITRDPFTIFFYIGSLFIISPQLTAFALVLLPISGLLIGRIGRSLKRTSTKGQNKLGVILSVIEETISGLRIIKSFNAIEFADKRFRKIHNEWARVMIRLYRKRDLASPLSEFLGVLVMVVILLYGGRLIISEKHLLDGTTFILYLVIFSQLLPPAKAITQAYSNIQKGAASADRIQIILDEPEVVVEKPNAIPIQTFKEKIEYRNVRFAYGSEPVLKNINLTITKGKTIALVGPSGSGKSTMVDLLPRFYDVTGGSLLIDNVPVVEYKISDVRGLMGIVSQDTILFNDTVFNNIAFGLENVQMEDVEAAARIANAHEFIIQMSDGYDTIIGDRGVKMSGGQRQRLSIARAVLRNPSILILDEATSALDTESERLVQEALENLMKNRTSIVIAHRLSTIQFADEIIVMQQGEIVERGTHTDLIARKGIYSKLCELQSFN